MTDNTGDYDQRLRICGNRILMERTVLHLCFILEYESAAISPSTSDFIEDTRKVINHLEERILSNDR